VAAPDTPPPITNIRVPNDVVIDFCDGAYRGIED
jgi:hypothetical protein